MISVMNISNHILLSEQQTKNNLMPLHLIHFSEMYCSVSRIPKICCWMDASI